MMIVYTIDRDKEGYPEVKAWPIGYETKKFYVGPPSGKYKETKKTHLSKNQVYLTPERAKEEYQKILDREISTTKRRLQELEGMRESEPRVKKVVGK